MSNTDPSTKKLGFNPGAREGYAVFASYKTPTVFAVFELVYVEYFKSLIND